MAVPWVRETLHAWFPVLVKSSVYNEPREKPAADPGTSPPHSIAAREKGSFGAHGSGGVAKCRLS